MTQCEPNDALQPLPADGTFTVINPHRRLILARVVRAGEAYGINNALTHDGAEPLVEFYDTAHRHSRDARDRMLGQFVTRYLLSTLMAGGRGLCMDGSVPVWTLSARNVRDIQDWLRIVETPALNA